MCVVCVRVEMEEVLAAAELMGSFISRGFTVCEVEAREGEAV